MTYLLILLSFFDPLDSARQMIDIEHYDQAVSYLNNLSTKNPDNHEVYFLKGMALQHLHKYPEAITQYSIALHLKSNHRIALINRSYCYRKTREFLAASTDLKKVLDLPVSNTSTIFYQLGENGRVRGMHTSFKDEAKIFRWLGICYFELEKKDSAHYFFSKAIQIGTAKHNILTYIEMARLFNQNQMNDAYQKAIRNAYKLDSLNPELQMLMADQNIHTLKSLYKTYPEMHTLAKLLASQLQKKGFYPEAAGYWQEHSYNEKKSENWYNTTFCMYKSGKLQEAMNWAMEGWKLYEDPLFMELMAHIAFAEKNYNEAKDYYEAVILFDLNQQTNRQNLAICYYYLGNPDKTCQYLIELEQEGYNVNTSLKTKSCN